MSGVFRSARIENMVYRGFRHSEVIVEPRSVTLVWTTRDCLLRKIRMLPAMYHSLETPRHDYTMGSDRGTGPKHPVALRRQDPKAYDILTDPTIRRKRSWRHRQVCTRSTIGISRATNENPWYNTGYCDED